MSKHAFKLSKGHADMIVTGILRWAGAVKTQRQIDYYDLAKDVCNKIGAKTRRDLDRAISRARNVKFSCPPPCIISIRNIKKHEH